MTTAIRTITTTTVITPRTAIAATIERKGGTVPTATTVAPEITMATATSVTTVTTGTTVKKRK